MTAAFTAIIGNVGVLGRAVPGPDAVYILVDLAVLAIAAWIAARAVVAVEPAAAARPGSTR